MAGNERSGEVTRVSSPVRCDGIAIATYFSAGNKVAREVIDETGTRLILAGIIPDGKVVEYYWNGTLKREFEYIGNKPHGPSREYFPGNRLLWVEQNFSDGILDGPSRTLYRNGSLWEACSYKKGMLHGDYRSYHENGNPDTIAYYENGSIEGEYRKYSVHGLPIEISIYKEGKWEGPRTIYYETGEIQYADTCMDGRVIFRKQFDSQGRFIREQGEPIPEIEKERVNEMEAALREGIEFTKMGCHYQAVRMFQKAIELESDSVEAHLKLSFAYRNLGMYDKLMETLNRALEFNPNHPGVCFQLAVAHIITGNRPEAIVGQEILKDIDTEYADELMYILQV